MNIILLVIIIVLSFIIIIEYQHFIKFTKLMYHLINEENISIELEGKLKLGGFHKAYDQLKIQVQNKNKFVHTYYKFMPNKMLDLLKIKDFSYLTLDKQSHTQVTILTVNIMEFHELTQTMESKKIFSFTNLILSKLVPVISNHGGVIDKFIGAGLTAFYIEDNEKALKSALMICRIMEQIEEVYVRETNIENPNCSIALCYGNVMMGIVGHEERLSAVAISEYIGLSYFLQSIADKYSTNILITHSYAEKIQDFHKKYNARFLGYILLKTTGTLEKIYDVFDGDFKEARWLKKKTRKVFEEGVRLYTSGEFERARLHFIEVLRESRNDRAAGEYLYLCDYYIKEENKHNAVIYLEVY